MDNDITEKLRIVKIKRSYFIVAGKSKLANFGRNLEAAKIALIEEREMLLYWAGSASVSIENADWVEINI